MVIIPTNQDISLNFSQNRIFDFNNVNSRFYLGQTANNAFRIFGDAILDGLETSAVLVNPSLIRFTISPGNLIIDGTFITYNTEQVINFDLSGIDLTSGKLILAIEFAYYHITNQNKSALSVTFILNNNKSIDRSWLIEKKHVLLDQYSINSGIIYKTPIPILNPPKVIIEDKDYMIRPMTNLEKRILSYINFTFN